MPMGKTRLMEQGECDNVLCVPFRIVRDNGPLARVILMHAVQLGMHQNPFCERNFLKMNLFSFRFVVIVIALLARRLQR